MLRRVQLFPLSLQLTARISIPLNTNLSQYKVSNMIYALGSHTPQLGEHGFVAPDATVIGQVVTGRDVTIWFNAVLRGDNALISIGDGSNIQDGSVLHVDPDIPLSIGKRVTIGHKVMLHGCTIGDGSLIGMNAVVLNHAVIGKNCLIGANALVTEKMQIPDGSLVLGSPAKVIKPVGEAAMAMMAAGTQSYVDKIDVYRDELRVVAGAGGVEDFVSNQNPA